MSNSAEQPWFQRFLEFHCDDCGCETAFCSRRRTFSERNLLPIFLLQPVRCAECFRRDYRSLIYAGEAAAIGSGFQTEAVCRHAGTIW
jgi:hypothetical protein